MNDSVETSVSMRFFPSLASALRAHLMARRGNVPMSLFTRGAVANISRQRLSRTPYPPHDRPRGAKDMASMQYHQRLVRQGHPVPPVWLLRKARGGKLVLLDGVHRVAALHLEGSLHVPAYLVEQV
jgi:hypothetical protein